MSTRVMALAWPIQCDMTAKAVLISLADNANDAGECWPSIDTISERTCISRRSVIEAIQRLEHAGLLSADRTNGRHTRYQLTLDQCATRTRAPAAPVRQPHDTRAPAALDPCASRTGPVRQPHSNRQEPSLTVIEPSPRARDDVAAPGWLDASTWRAWLDHRRAMKKPLNVDAQKRTLSKLERFMRSGHDPNAVIDDAIVNGWQGLFEPRKANVHGPPARVPTRLESAAASFAGTARQPQRTTTVIDVTPTATALLG